MPRPRAAAVARLALGALLIAPASYAARDLPDFAALVHDHGVEVVNVSTFAARRERSSSDGDEVPDDAASDGTGSVPPSDSASLGSGFVISPNGYLLTCAHVVDGATEIVVRLSDRREYRARLIGADRRSDIA